MIAMNALKCQILRCFTHGRVNLIVFTIPYDRTGNSPSETALTTSANSRTHDVNIKCTCGYARNIGIPGNCTFPLICRASPNASANVARH